VIKESSARGAANDAEPVRLLLVEDSVDDAMLLERRLARAFPGLRCRRVDNAEDMRAALAAGGWDLVISDHSMPGFDSAAALRLVRESGLDLPFILYTGRLDERDGASAMHIGADDWVSKHDPARLVPVVERELRHVRLRREKESAERSARELAQYDPLTRLPNRSLFCELAARALADSGTAHALLYADIDRFMRVNDTLGYAHGDGLIRQVAARLRAGAPESGLVARLSQDEFALLCAAPGGASAVRRIAARLAQRFAEPLAAGGQEFYLTLSVGIALTPEHGADVQTLLRNAESAMRLAKRLGGNGHQFYRPEIQAISSENLRLESELRHAIARGELFLVYQPVVDLASGRIEGAEALLRWRHPEFGLVPPDRFIGLADETGQIHGIGEWVLERACAQARRWLAAGAPPFTMAVNVSPTQFRHRDFADRVRAIVRASGLPGECLEIEITESAAMQDAETTIETLAALKQAGVRVAIDDFGTGYSSLSYLKRLPIDILKIDKSFIRDVPGDAENVAIVRTILALASTMKLRSHAEGVETEAQAAYLRAEGCHRAQGWLLGRPQLAEDFGRLLGLHGPQQTSLCAAGALCAAR